MKGNIMTKLVRRGGITRLIIGLAVVGLDVFLLYNAVKNRPTLIPLLIIFAAGVLLALWGLKDLVLTRTHKVFRQAAALGNGDEAEAYLAEADGCGQTIYRSGSAQITRQYTVCESRGIQIFMTQAIMWAYKHTTINRRNGVETHRDYHLMLAVEGHKRLHKIVFSEAELNACLEALSTAQPTIIMGYSDELFKLYRKQQADFVAQWQRFKQNQRLQQV